jgi:hypothetical protein
LLALALEDSAEVVLEQALTRPNKIEDTSINRSFIRMDLFSSVDWLKIIANRDLARFFNCFAFQ